MLSITIIAGYLGMLWMLYQAAKDGLVGDMGLPILIIGTFGYAILSLRLVLGRMFCDNLNGGESNG